MIGSAPLVVFSERLGAIGDQERRIEAAGARLVAAPLWDLDSIRQHAAGASAIILGAVEPFDAAALEVLDACRVVVRRGVGHDNVDAAAATRLGIMVAIVPDASVEEVSDHALAMLLTLERRLVPLDAAVHAGAWGRDPAAVAVLRAPARRFSELTLGVVGLGRIGQALARKGQALYRRIVAADPVLSAARAAELGVELVPLSELTAESHHLSLHAPLTPATANLVDAAFLAGLKPGAILVNTSRGGLLDQAAVIEALHSGRLGGAGLDVTATEPLPAGDPLLDAPGVLLTAHSASASTTAKSELARRSVDAVLAVLGGGRPAVLVNPEVLDRPALRPPLPGTMGGAGT